VTWFGTLSTAVTTSMLYQKEAFAFATADLVMPGGVDFSAREVLDGISIRIVRDYDINNDNYPCRLDVLRVQDAASAARLPPPQQLIAEKGIRNGK
jgi:hypothetical protein